MPSRRPYLSAQYGIKINTGNDYESNMISYSMPLSTQCFFQYWFSSWTSVTNSKIAADTDYTRIVLKSHSMLQKTCIRSQ